MEISAQDGERSVRPVVARARPGLPGWAIGVCAALAALLLFLVLDVRRRSLAAPTTAARAIDLISLPAAPPPLAIPPEAAPPEVAPSVILEPLAIRPAPPLSAVSSFAPHEITPATAAQTPPPKTQPPRVAGAGGPTLAVDNSVPRILASAAPNASAAPTALPGFAGSTDRARASIFANRATTVPQGTLIPAVLETAFDSTRAGFARAIVSRNVMGFDGTRVLIPRGSRLVGEYQSDTTPGQKRALIVWTRLIRDDGATIAVGSPATDPLGRGGVRANVDSHFFERFSGAILQSALNVGVNLASRAADGTVILALPNTVQGGTNQSVQPVPIPPTLSVRAGSSISIFVARDLDFTDVETR